LIRDDSGRRREVWRPARIGERGDEDLAGLDLLVRIPISNLSLMHAGSYVNHTGISHIGKYPLRIIHA